MPPLAKPRPGPIYNNDVPNQGGEWPAGDEELGMLCSQDGASEREDLGGRDGNESGEERPRGQLGRRHSHESIKAKHRPSQSPTELEMAK